MNFYESSQYLESRTMFGIKLGLGNVRTLLKKLGNPHNSLNFIHLAGTNGKGSTASLLNASLMECGKVGLFTSPHLISVQERVRINGIPVDQTLFAEAMTQLAEVVETFKDEDLEPTYFETVTLIAILIFSKQNCDFVIWETGMGGRLDATNVVTPIVSIITNCALDHCTYLGDSIEEIALEKGGIIKSKVPVFFGGSDKKVLNILRIQASEVGAPFLFRGNDFFIHNYSFSDKGMTTETSFQDGMTITAKTKLWGRHQASNVSLTVAVLRYLSLSGRGVNFRKSIIGIENALWPGRLQELNHEDENYTFIDGAHNPHAAIGLVASLSSRFPQKKWNVVVGILQDKEFRQFLEVLDQIAESYTILPVNNPRTASTEEICTVLKEIAPDKIVKTGSISEIKSYLKGDTLITGSLYLIGDIIKEFTGDTLPPVI